MEGGANLSRISCTLITSNFNLDSSSPDVDFSAKMFHPHKFENIAPSLVRKGRGAKEKRYQMLKLHRVLQGQNKNK